MKIYGAPLSTGQLRLIFSIFHFLRAYFPPLSFRLIADRNGISENHKQWTLTPALKSTLAALPLSGANERRPVFARAFYVWFFCSLPLRPALRSNVRVCAYLCCRCICTCVWYRLAIKPTTTETCKCVSLCICCHLATRIAAAFGQQQLAAKAALWP